MNIQYMEFYQNVRKFVVHEILHYFTGIPFTETNVEQIIRLQHGLWKYAP